MLINLAVERDKKEIREMDKRLLGELLRKLAPRERKVMRVTLNLEGVTEEEKREVKEISRPFSRRIIAKALLKLRRLNKR